MRLVRTILGICILGLIATGCAGLLGRLLPEPDVSPPVCVVHYIQLAPLVELGEDGCGNVWIRFSENDTLKCEIISDDGTTMIPISCPAEGDTLGD